MGACYVGIDVSKDRLDGHAHPAGTVFSTARNGAGLEELVATLNALAPALVAVEATGAFETVMAALAGSSLPVVVVNPAQVRHFGQALGKRGQDRPDRRGCNRPLRRSHEARAAPASRRDEAASGRSRRPPTADR